MIKPKAVLAIIASTLISEVFSSEYDHNVWFDAPYIYTTLGTVTGTRSIEECVKACAYTGACSWAGRSDATRVCELRGASGDLANFRLRSAIVVKSNDPEYSDRSDFYQEFEEKTVAAFPTAKDWCFLDSKKTGSLGDCKKLCEDDKGCGRVSLNTETDVCILEQACGDLNSIYRGLQTIGTTGKYVDIPPDYKCKGTRIKELKSVPSLIDCKLECDNTKDCTAVSLNTKEDMCSLYSRCNRYVDNGNTLTSLLSDGNYVKIPEGFNCWGPAVRSGIPEIKTLGECIDQCDLYSECGALTFNTADQKCYLKESCNEYELKNEFQKSAVRIVVHVPAKAYADLPYGDGYGYRCKGEPLGKLIDGMNSHDECKKECNANAKCEGLSYRKTKGRCQLYKDCDTYNASFEEITSVVLKDGKFVNIPSGYGCKSTSLEAPIQSPSFPRCKAECEITYDCFAVSYNFDENKCYLKPSCNEYEIKDDNRSSRKI